MKAQRAVKDVHVKPLPPAKRARRARVRDDRPPIPAPASIKTEECVVTLGDMIMQKKHNMCTWLCDLPQIDAEVRSRIKGLDGLRCDLFISHFRKDVLPDIVATRRKFSGDEAACKQALQDMLNKTFDTELPAEVCDRLMEYYACFEAITNPDSCIRAQSSA